MQMVRNSVILLLLLPLLAMLLMPKKELYYLLDKKLEAQNIIISGEVLLENPLGLTVEHPTFYLGGAPIATAKEISLWSILFYTKADFLNLVIAKGMPTALDIERLDAQHFILSPLKVTLAGESSLGSLDGEVQLRARTLHLNIAKGGENSALSKYLKKSEKGWVYESKF